MKRSVSHKTMMLVLILVSIGAFLLAFFMGSSGISLPEFWAMLRGEASAAQVNIFMTLRLPRALLAFCVGAALSVSGCALQGVFQNPIADPYVLGISGGAALGATIALAFSIPGALFGVSMTTVFAFAFALAAIMLVYTISKVRGKVSTFSLLLSGFALSSMCTALIYCIMLFNRDKMEHIIMWNMGSLSSASWERFFILLPVLVVCFILLRIYQKPLNILLTGDEVSQSLGVDTNKIRRNLIILTALLTTAAVSVSGIIGFVGLMIPHILRMIAGPNHVKLMPVCFVGGGAYLLLCDTVAKTILPGTELPVGIITALFGVPFFIYLLRRGKARGA